MAVPHCVSSMLPLPKFVHDGTKNTVHRRVPRDFPGHNRPNHLQLSSSSGGVTLHEIEQVLEVLLLDGGSRFTNHARGDVHRHEQLTSFGVGDAESPTPCFADLRVKIFRRPAQALLVQSFVPSQVVGTGT